MQNYSNLFLKILYYCFRCNVNNVRLFLKTLNTKKQWFQSLSYNTSAIQGGTSVTRATRCDTSATRTTQARHEWKILITTRLKTYFHTPIFTIWQMKDYKERHNFILGPAFCKCLIPMSKCVWKVHYKNWTS